MLLMYLLPLMCSMEVLVVNNRGAELVADLLELWNRSVRVTHNFLTEDDISA